MIEKVVVVGAGQMGAGIAQVAAVAGLRVTLVDVGEEPLARALTAIGGSLAKLASKGQVDDPDAALARIATATDLADADGSELAMRASTAPGSSHCPLEASFASDAAMPARPRSSCSSPTSTSVTCMPAAAATCAIPAPI